MDVWHHLILFPIALLAGGINAVAGGGSFFVFPALLMTGIPATSANATNTMALWPGTVSSVVAYREEIVTHKRDLLRLSLLNLGGGLTGALLLLYIPEQRFEALVPWLLLIATLLFAFSRKLTAFFRGHHIDATHTTVTQKGWSLALQFVIAVYGGFFGAGIGILMLALFALLGYRNIHEMNALKAFLSCIINLIAVVAFAVAGIIVWPVALMLMVASTIGGYAGARIAKKVPDHRVRQFVLLCAVSMTAYFFVKPYLS